MATDPATIRQLEETIAGLRRQHEAQTSTPAAMPQALDPTLLAQMVANEVARQTRLQPQPAVPVAAPAQAVTAATPSVQASDFQKLAMVAVLGEENTAWLLAQNHLDLMAFAVSKEGREALAMVADEARAFVRNLRPAPAAAA